MTNATTASSPSASWQRLARIVIALLSVVFVGAGLTACSDEGGKGGKDFDGSLKIIAATELQDLEPLLKQASEELGFDIVLEFPAGTLENSRNLANGGFDGNADATLFATNRYLNLLGASDKLADSTEIAKSPVAFGVWSNKAKELGWDTKQPSWEEFAKAAEDGKFTFGMTDPQTSNSGFSAVVSVATALADTGEALNESDIAGLGNQLSDLFKAQTIISGSSGWLSEAFIADPEKADAIVNYESVLHKLKDQGHDITVIVPSDGVITADYPLSTLASPQNEDAGEKVQALSEWLLDHSQDIANSYRRPVRDVESMPSQLQGQTLIELPFPANMAVADDLVDSYNNEYRAAGKTTFILDTSGSMEGDRMDSLKQIMNSLIDGSATTTTGPVGLRDNESVTLQPFSTRPMEPLTVTFKRNNARTVGEMNSFINGLRAEGQTAIYDTLLQALENADVNGGIPSIVLFSDGEVTHGPDYYKFADAYERLPEEKKSIPVFIILYGEASEAEMNDLANLTGGKVFDAMDGDLAAAFKEIRGYQ